MKYFVEAPTSCISILLASFLCVSNLIPKRFEAFSFDVSFPSISFLIPRSSCPLFSNRLHHSIDFPVQFRDLIYQYLTWPDYAELYFWFFKKFYRHSTDFAFNSFIYVFQEWKERPLGIIYQRGKFFGFESQVAREHLSWIVYFIWNIYDNGLRFSSNCSQNGMITFKTVAGANVTEDNTIIMCQLCSIWKLQPCSNRKEDSDDVIEPVVDQMKQLHTDTRVCACACNNQPEARKGKGGSGTNDVILSWMLLKKTPRWSSSIFSCTTRAG